MKIEVNELAIKNLVANIPEFNLDNLTTLDFNCTLTIDNGIVELIVYDTVDAIEIVPLIEVSNFVITD